MFDPERAKEGPFGAPIAHGQLTLSIMSFLPGGAGVGLPALDGMKLGINYGWNKVRFMNPVQVGAENSYRWQATECGRKKLACLKSLTK
jgi:acyl dehydratase